VTNYTKAICRCVNLFDTSYKLTPAVVFLLIYFQLCQNLKLWQSVVTEM